MDIKAYKMDGLGNDFVIIDQRDNSLELSKQQIIKICDRKFIGCDQLIIIKKNKEFDANLEFFNSDGSSSGACGNGTRCVAYLLHKEKKVKKYYKKEFFIKKIKERFTQILAIFLEYQIQYVLKRKELANNDVEMWFIIGSLLYNQIMFLKKSEKKSHYQKEWIEEVLNVGDKRGINAMSISDLTGIPRPTVIRKLKILLKQKDIYKDDNNLYYLMNGNLFNELNKQRLINIKNLSSTISRINNIIFFS